MKTKDSQKGERPTSATNRKESLDLVRSSTGISQESLQILMLMPRWKPWSPNPMSTALLS